MKFARGLNKAEAFYLASNMKAAGKFDDIVFKIGDQTLFLQLKHRTSTTKSKININRLIKEKGDFSLVEYFNSYCEIKRQWPHSKELQNCGKFENSIFIIYTNATMTNDVGHDINTADLHSVLSSGGKSISFIGESSLIEHFEKESGFMDFLSQLRFFTGQAAEDQLDDLIRQEIVTLCGTSSVYKLFLEGVQDWWQSKNYYLTNQAPFWKTILKACVDKISEQKLEEITALQIRFKEDRHDVIRSHVKSTKRLHITTDNSLLSCLKVHSFATQYHILVVSKTMQLHYNEVLALWGRWCDLLIVVEADIVNMATLTVILPKHPQRRLIVVGGTLPSDTQNKFITVHDDITVGQLDDASQKRVLTAMVQFQGYDVQLGEITSSNHDLIPADIITQLLTDKIVLGDALAGDTDYYISRTMQHSVEVNEQILSQTGSYASVILAVSGMADSELQQLVSNRTSGKQKNKCKVEAIITEDEFLKLTESCKNVHWLHRKGNGFLWKQARGDKHIVMKHLNKFQNVDSVMDIPHHVVLLSAGPGMGKSTLLTHLALGTKKAHPTMWVVRVNINDFSGQLEKLPQNLQLHDVIEFLLCVSGITVKWIPFFRCKLETMQDVCVLIDGYDEICPTYADKVVLLLKCLQATKLQKLWVTTRPIMKDKLEKQLSIWAFTLQPFLKSDQQNFLTKFWKRNIPNIEEHVLKKFVTVLLQFTATSLNDRDREFFGIPLQSMLLAEAFQKNLKTYNEKGVVDLEPQFDMVQLYRWFVDRKFEIFCDKNNVNKPKSRGDYYYEVMEQTFKENHMLSALFLLFPSADIEMFPDSKLMTDKYKSFIKPVMEGKERTGIIKQILNEKPVFIHRTFAEYFAAMWFAKNFTNVQQYLNTKMFDRNFKIIKNFFDQTLAKEFRLHVAVLKQDKTSVETLLSVQKLDANGVDEGGRTALHLAVMNDTEGSDSDPIHSTAQQIIAILLDNGADPNIEDKVLGWQPLRIAERVSNWSAVELLLEKKADSSHLVLTKHKIRNNEYINDILLAATRYGFVQIVAFVLQCGIQVEHTINVLHEESYCTCTMLHEAARHGQVKLVEFLLNNKINTMAQDSRYDRTALMWAAEQGHVEVTDILTKQSTDINISDKYHNTALLIAAKNKRWDVAIILSHHADVTACDWSGNNVLHLATESGHTEFVFYLLNTEQISIDCCNSHNQTPLWLAARSGWLKVTQLLLEHNANLHVQDMEGHTPLDAAAAGHHRQVQQLLLQQSDRSTAHINEDTNHNL